MKWWLLGVYGLLIQDQSPPPGVQVLGWPCHPPVSIIYVLLYRLVLLTLSLDSSLNYVLLRYSIFSAIYSKVVRVFCLFVCVCLICSDTPQFILFTLFNKNYSKPSWCGFYAAPCKPLNNDAIRFTLPGHNM